MQSASFGAEDLVGHVFRFCPAARAVHQYTLPVVAFVRSPTVYSGEFPVIPNLCEQMFDIFESIIIVDCATPVACVWSVRESPAGCSLFISEHILRFCSFSYDCERKVVPHSAVGGINRLIFHTFRRTSRNNRPKLRFVSERGCAIWCVPY